MLNKQTISIMAVLLILVLIITAWAGILPLSIMGQLETETQNKEFHEIKGIGELLDREGYILSYNNEGFSETIEAAGAFSFGESGFADIDGYRYIVSVRPESSNAWTVISKPGSTASMVNKDNPGMIRTPNLQYSNKINTEPYTFNLVGSEYDGGGIRVELQLYVNGNDLFFWQEHIWKTVQIDEAYLFQGSGALLFPTDAYGDPVRTFEIGEEVKIGVETGKGGGGPSRPWRVTLNEPYSGTINDPDDGGGVVIEKYYPDDCDASNTHFSFTVTEEMAAKSMAEGYYTIRIWNTLYPRGSLQTHFVDFASLCPGNAAFSDGAETVEVGETYSIEVSAAPNDESGVDIDYFDVSVIYGSSDTLLPDNPLSERYILGPYQFGGDDSVACAMPQKISFVAEREGYVTIHATPVDTAGRAARQETYFTILAHEEGEAPDPQEYEGQTGEGYYGGGHTEPWLPWIPSADIDGDGDADGYDYILIGAAVLIVIVGMLLAFLPTSPVPGDKLGRLIALILSIVAALLFLFGGW